MRIDGDFYQIAGANFEEQCICAGVTAEIQRGTAEHYGGVGDSMRILRGGIIFITPQQPSLSLSSQNEYEIRSKDKTVRFRPSQIGIAIEHKNDGTLIRTAQ